MRYRSLTDDRPTTACGADGTVKTSVQTQRNVNRMRKLEMEMSCKAS